MAGAKHLHTYEQIRSRPDYYRCLHPDCSHYTHRDLLPHKRVLCPFCQRPFILDQEALALALPRCVECVGKREHDMKPSTWSLSYPVAPATKPTGAAHPRAKVTPRLKKLRKVANIYEVPGSEKMAEVELEKIVAELKEREKARK